MPRRFTHLDGLWAQLPSDLVFPWRLGSGVRFKSNRSTGSASSSPSYVRPVPSSETVPVPPSPPPESTLPPQPSLPLSADPLDGSTSNCRGPGESIDLVSPGSAPQVSYDKPADDASQSTNLSDCYQSDHVAEDPSVNSFTAEYEGGTATQSQYPGVRPGRGLNPPRAVHTNGWIMVR